MNPWAVLGRAGRAWLEEIFFLVALGLGTLLAGLLVIPGPFVWAGLWAAAARAVEGRGLSWESVWMGVKRWGLSFWLLAALIGVGYLFVLGDLAFYGNPRLSPLPPAWLPWLNVLWGLVGIGWTGVVFYLPAVFLLMERPALFPALRASLGLVLRHPLPTLVWVVVLVLLTGLAFWLPILWALLPGFHATLSLVAVRALWGLPWGQEDESGV